MEVAKVTAKRSTCLRRNVGCVLLNARGHVLATGYNGVAAGRPHCNEEVEDAPKDRCGVRVSSTEWCHQRYGHEGGHGQFPHACEGACSPSGTNLDGCEAIHAEQNALLQCKDVYAIDTCYCTTSCCVTCVKLLLNTSCRRIVFEEEYSQPHAKEMWEAAGRVWEMLR